MAVAATEKFLHLSRPIAPATIGIPGNIAPLTVNIQPQAILSILDHAVRRDIRDTQSTRVIGALVGVRSEDGTEVEVRSCFAIPHTENEDQVEVDVDYQKNMLALTLKANPRESLLGWYTTTHELNSFSALIQNFFASPETGTFPHPAVHLTISTDPTSDIEARCYISAPVAVNAERAAESCLFIQVPHKLMYGDAERSALEAISMAKDTEDRTAPVVSDIEGLARSIESGTNLIERVSDWVNGILDEDEEPNQALGQYLMNALSLAPKVDPEQIEHDFNNHIQDVLMVSYLANTIRTQIDLSQRLAVANLTSGEKDGEGKQTEGGEKGEQRGGGGRGGKRGGRGGGRGGGQRGEPREPREPREPTE
ncbi:Mov34/MPN/PAD-1 family protein [Colletotrichum graminicola]|uniref:Eukaryotic translation initiation factor 3 subunit F n=1 Tax=Colletotrichum graminicola (strain M1.001 / M2 / FGSC 10212) TaxID=645133 RepID=E3QBI2_COLGM|nr:Mov34/MPN/PAD-1 family protein [Colletotrichum graminicola M1.001]EFQ28321.1 Mov34/MPN/PAD-1 family protein [Colletotrichum graminicola M1.001]WDK20679.1 Mov34/MPN/PAD-1 family protein [Colletotrichum graminicola]